MKEEGKDSHTSTDTSDSDDDDDNVNVIITDTSLIKKEEEECIDHLREEIWNLAKLSATTSATKRMVVLYVHQTLFQIPDTITLSDQLKEAVWSSACLSNSYREMKNGKVFEEILSQNSVYFERREDVIGFFGARYRKMGAPSIKRQVAYRQQSSQHSNNMFLYQDFCLIIIKNRKILNYAIHGHFNNMSKLIAEYNPRRIYYDSSIGGPLEVFVNYKSQPFYDAMKNRTVPLPIERLEVENFNPTVFCDRCDPYCSLCLTLKYVVRFYNDRPARQQARLSARDLRHRLIKLKKQKLV
jgi:hypothetical protein